jgi:hypothetical protein
MSLHQYLELAERYRKVIETAKDTFTRYHLEAMERSYRALADSERELQKARYMVDALGKLGDSDKAK